MGKFLDLKGTSQTSFQVQIGGPRIANESGKIAAKNAANNAYADLLGDILRAAGNSLVLNDDAAGAGADWKYTISRPSSGMTGAVTLTLPVDDGTAGQILQTDGAGNLSWASPSGGNALLSAEFDLIAATPSGQNAWFTTPVNAIIHEVFIIIDTPFDTAATVSVGIAATVDKFMTTAQNDLQGLAKDRYESNPGNPAIGAEIVTVNYTPASATVGAARIIMVYSEPN